MTRGPVEPPFQLLADAVRLLEGVGEQHWAAWLRGDLRRLRRGDGFAIEHLLSAYGGMGSINDVLISPHNGHDVSEHEGEVTTAELRRLLSAIYHSASGLRRTSGSAAMSA
ncbi:hypothetical protein J2X46_002972 [Nocardioides sp. BE266]|uniref:DUF6966 domain-containing protein n=1 Tax=Nocardioides sp. BE266 TaxID=2817725 RepID=UPI002859F243|nr:hypothetical protein [Nocardioides sp. BE266]MDR7253982.1 hypothetical protein [Nocardioides sp. BE266]